MRVTLKQTTDLPPPYQTDLQDKFQNLLNRNMSNLSEVDWNHFSAYKEQQYRIRKRKIFQFCQTQPTSFSSTILENALLVDEKDGIGYCQVISTTITQIIS